MCECIRIAPLIGEKRTNTINFFTYYLRVLRLNLHKNSISANEIHLQRYKKQTKDITKNKTEHEV